MNARIGSFGKFLSFLPILLVEALNPLFVISIALYVGLGYILTLLMPVAISHWQAVFWLSVVVPFILLMVRAISLWHGTSVEETSSVWKRFLPLLPLLFLVPVFVVELTYPDLQLPGHGDLHIAYALQLQYGTTPIESVFLAGYPANYYWLYHAFLAVLASFTSYSLPTVGSIVNLLAILSSLLWIAQTLIELRLARARTVYLGLLAILVYCSVNMTGIASLFGAIAEDENVLRSLRFMLLDGADRRLHSVLGKSLNFTSMALAIMFFCSAFYACVKLVKRDWSLLILTLISASGIAGLAMQPMATLYIVLVLLGGVLLTSLISLVGAKSISSRFMLVWRRLRHSVSPALLVSWLLVSLGLALPLLLYIKRFSSVNAAGVSFSLFSPANVSMLIAALALLLPFMLILSLNVVWKGRALERFLWFGCVLAIIWTSALIFPDSNQYKGVFFGAILVSTSALLANKSLNTSRNRFLRYASRLSVAVLLALTFTKIVWVNYFYIQKARTVQFDYDGRSLVNLAGDNDEMDAYYWVRDHTSPQSVVVYPVQSYRYTNAFHERLPYVKKKQKWHTDNIPAYDERVERLSLFYDSDTSLADYRRLLEEMQNELPGRPLYAVVDNSELSQELMARRGALAVFAPQGAGTSVYC